MFDQSIKQDRPPYVTFMQVAVEDRDASIEAGHYVAKDVDFARIMPPGGEIVEREVAGWFENMEQKVREGRFNEDWLHAFRKKYSMWKEGLEIPLEGTPIKSWPGLSPAQYKTLEAIRVFTVEDLANANEQTLRAFGMGAHGIQERARAYLRSSADVGKVAEENSALSARLKDLEEQVKTLILTNKSLSQELDTLKPKKV